MQVIKNLKRKINWMQKKNNDIVSENRSKNIIINYFCFKQALNYQILI